MFKQYYTYFYMLFYSYVFLKNTNNVTRIILSNGLLKVTMDLNPALLFLDSPKEPLTRMLAWLPSLVFPFLSSLFCLVQLYALCFVCFCTEKYVNSGSLAAVVCVLYYYCYFFGFWKQLLTPAL